jgi:uncharacterized protein YfaS (alpha-2-macroglobulin family)
MSRKPFLVLILIALIITACTTVTPTSELKPIPTISPSIQPTFTQPPRKTPALPTLTTEIQVEESSTPVPMPPRVTSRSPDTTLIDDYQPEIVLTFSRPMDQASVASALTTIPKIPYFLRWEEDGLHIDLLEPLTPQTWYRFSIAQTAMDQNGNPMTQSYNWSYTVKGVFGSLTIPTASKLNQPVSLRFRYSMDTTSVETALKIEPEYNITFSWDTYGKILTITSDEQFPPETAVTISFISPILDAEGNEYPPPDPVSFTTPPPILSVRPSADSRVHPNTNIAVTFDRLMDTSTTESAFSITPHTPGRFEWEETTLSFVPDYGTLTEYTQYTITVAITATSLTGESILRQPYTWKFTTDKYQDLANFGEYGANAQVLDIHGRKAVQFVLMSEKTAQLTFELYRMDLEEFLDRYSSGFRGIRGWEPQPPIPTDDLSIFKSWQQDFRPSGMGYGNTQEVLIPGDVPPGFYILNLVAGHINDQLILILTRSTLVVKQAEGQIIAWVSDINGRHLEGVEVSVYARDGSRLTQGETNEKGVYRTEVNRYPQPLIVVARQGNDYTVSGLSNEWRTSTGYWWGWWVPTPTTRDISAYIYTDRPIYKPGQQVYFKAILRHDDDATLSLPDEGTPVSVRIRDARNNIVQTIELTTNAFGAIDGEFHLAEGAMLGNYAVEVSLDEGALRQQFKVQDYKKPDIQINVASETEKYITGDPIDITVDTQYFFGEPVANAQLSIHQYILSPSWYGYGYQTSEESEYIWYQSGEAEIKARTDENGCYTFTIPAKARETDDDYYYYRGSSLRETTLGIEVTVDDGSNQLVSGFAVVKVYNAAEQLSLDTGGYFKTPNEAFEISASAHDLDGEPVPDRELTIQMLRWNRDDWAYTTVISTQNTKTGADGKAAIPIVVSEAGYYRLRVEGVDRFGNPISFWRGMYIFSQEQPWMRYQDTSALSIMAERDSYAPGETATLLIESTFSGPALLTFERGTTRHEELIYLNAPMTSVDIVIREDYAPNIFISVNAWQEQDTNLDENTFTNLPDSRLYSASTEIVVPITEKTLNISLIPEQETYAPRQEASFTIRVTDSTGKPIRAEVALALVDEAIFSLSDELGGPIYDAFYDARSHSVRTFDSMALQRELWVGGLGGGGGDDFGAPGNPRSDFPDTAAWYPTVHTNANGEATITITLPDNLTSWRLTAKATTAETTQVGEASINILTQQPVIVRPILPRNLTAGDQAQFAAFIHNYSNQTQQVEVAIFSNGLEIQEPIQQSPTIEAGQVGVVGWGVTALDGFEQAEITISANLDGDIGDAVSLILPIQPLAIAEVQSWTGDFSGQFDTVIPWPEDALSISTLQIDLNRSIAGSLLTGLEFLTGFPYGCVEQTMSKALPNAVIGRAFKQLGVGNPTLQADLPPKINAGLQRLYGYQHNDGGWGWWFDDESEAYNTAWVVFGLSVTAEAGYEVDPTVIQRGAEWLSSQLGSTTSPTIRAYALYSLANAGYGSLEEAQSLLEEIQDLDHFSQFALALALHELGDTQSAIELLDSLIESAIVQDGEVHWSGANHDGKYNQKMMSSDTRTTALALSVLVKILPGHILEDGVVQWLMSQRTYHGWGTTNETSHAILGLTDYLLSQDQTSTETGFSVELNGQVIERGTFDREMPFISIIIPNDQLLADDNELKITQTGEGKLYYVVSSRFYLEETVIDPAGDIDVNRAYLNPATNQPITEIHPGDLVKVHLTVRMPRDGSYMIVEDHLPGGLEALNESLNTTSHQSCQIDEFYEDPCQPIFYWSEYGYNYKEVWSDRVSFFVSELKANNYSYIYLARATQPGIFIALPAEVSAMYDPTLWGRSGSDQVSIIADQ